MRGTPSTSATMLTAKLVCSCVCLNRLFSTTLALASRFRLMIEVGLAAGRLVVDVGDAVELAGVDQLLDAPGDGLAARLVGQLGDDDLHAAAPASRLLDLGLGPHLHAAAAGAVGLHDPGPAHDEAARREVGTLHELHQVVGRGVGVVDEVDGGVDDLAQVVGRDVGGHADGDALAAVDQQVGEAGGQHDGLLGGAVVGRR